MGRGRRVGTLIGTRTSTVVAGCPSVTIRVIGGTWGVCGVRAGLVCMGLDGRVWDFCRSFAWLHFKLCVDLVLLAY